MKRKGELQFSFAWIFAIIAGAFILFLAIFGVTKFIGIEKTSSDAQTAKDISVLLNPLESSFESGKKSLISTQAETRIYTGCSETGFFGKQLIKTNQKIDNKWSETDINIVSQNKYIFSKDYADGKDFYIYSKPFNLPFKVADLLYLTSSEDKYCFIEPPDEIENEILSWNSENLFIDANCPENSINICFKDGGNCNIVVNENSKFVKKTNEIVYYEGNALIYAAIFSDKESYECQLKRLMKRTEQLSLIYKDKANFLFQKTGCSSALIPDLVVLGNYARNFDNSEDLSVIYNFADTLQTKNERSKCRLW